MTVKMLLPPAGKHGSFIVGVNGRLRVIDRRGACKGYANCCRCPDCLARESEPTVAPEAPRQPWEPKAA